jgi:hypothetical protein
MSGLSSRYQSLSPAARVLDAEAALSSLVSALYDLVWVGYKELSVDPKWAKEAALAGASSGMPPPPKAGRLRNVGAFNALMTLFQHIPLSRTRLDVLDRIFTLFTLHPGLWHHHPPLPLVMC